MNSDRLAGAWNQVKGSLKEAFGKLTDDDMLQMEGSLDQTTGVLQERYGYSKERAQQEWDAFINKYNSASSSVVSSTDQYLKDSSNSVSDKVENLVDRGERAVKSAVENVKDVADAAKKKLQG